MARFDVYRLRGQEIVVDCQATAFSSLQTRFIVPLRPPHLSPPLIPRLNPVFEIDDETLNMLTQYARSVPTREIKSTIGSLEDHDIQILAALDMLISGY